MFQVAHPAGTSRLSALGLLAPLIRPQLSTRITTLCALLVLLVEGAVSTPPAEGVALRVPLTERSCTFRHVALRILRMPVGDAVFATIHFLLHRGKFSTWGMHLGALSSTTYLTASRIRSSALVYICPSSLFFCYGKMCFNLEISALKVSQISSTSIYGFQALHPLSASWYRMSSLGIH